MKTPPVPVGTKSGVFDVPVGESDLPGWMERSMAPVVVHLHNCHGTWGGGIAEALTTGKQKNHRWQQARKADLENTKKKGPARLGEYTFWQTPRESEWPQASVGQIIVNLYGQDTHRKPPQLNEMEKGLRKLLETGPKHVATYRMGCGDPPKKVCWDSGVKPMLQKLAREFGARFDVAYPRKLHSNINCLNGPVSPELPSQNPEEEDSKRSNQQNLNQEPESKNEPVKQTTKDSKLHFELDGGGFSTASTEEYVEGSWLKCPRPRPPLDTSSLRASQRGPPEGSLWLDGAASTTSVFDPELDQWIKADKLGKRKDAESVATGEGVGRKSQGFFQDNNGYPDNDDDDPDDAQLQRQGMDAIKAMQSTLRDAERGMQQRAWARVTFPGLRRLKRSKKPRRIKRQRRQHLRQKSRRLSRRRLGRLKRPKKPRRIERQRRKNLRQKLGRLSWRRRRAI
eukprot:TRINITY_DN5932_c0_g1_i3.p1 TRINITY_DN5932_c0_g1~~TRINITY_DN5932_c0_g1_i3.p1  ORF type:complete len:454 (+),score=57.06 TRINITY_DN5932_c0_g1_i3:134-1495(+)